MSSGLRGTIKNHLGEISELSIKGYFSNKNQNTSKYEEILNNIENCLSIDRLDDKTKMIIGKYWHPKYPISKTHFEETFKHLDLNKHQLKEEPNFDLGQHTIQTYATGMSDKKHKIKFLDLSGEGKEIVLKNINFGDYTDDSIIIVNKEIIFDNCNIWLCGKRIHFIEGGKFILKGTTNLFGGILISHLYNGSPIEIINSTHESIIKMYGLEIGILPKTDGGQSFVSTSFIKIKSNINRFNMSDCNIFINCNENFDNFNCDYTSVHTVSLIHDGDIEDPDVTYSLILNKIFIDGRFNMKPSKLQTYENGYGISLIYSRGNISITNNTYQLHGVDSILNTSLSNNGECSRCDTVCKIENSAFNITDVTKLFTTCIKNYIIKNVKIAIGSTQNSNELIANGYPDLFRFNKTIPIKNLNIKIYDSIIRCYSNLDGIVCLRNDNTTTNDSSIKVYIDNKIFYDSENADVTIDKINGRIGFKLNPFNESDAITEYEIHCITTEGKSSSMWDQDTSISYSISK